MKKFCFFVVAGVISFVQTSKAQSVGIGTSTPDAAAMLEIQSSTSGLLMPRLNTSQKTSIPAPPAGLLVYDDSKSLFSFFNGTQWTDINASTTKDSIWDTYLSNSERIVYNALGQHVYINGLVMQPLGSPTTADGVLTLGHTSEPPSTTSYYISMDGVGIQARLHNGTILNPPVDANLSLNRYGGNVGIGLINPTKAAFHVNGAVGNTMAIFQRNSSSAGIALVGDWPGIYGNCYYNGSTKSMTASGYSGVFALDQNDGAFSFITANGPNEVADADVSMGERLRISTGGEVLSSITNKLFNMAPLAVISGGYRFVTTDGTTGVTTEKEIIRSEYPVSVSKSGIELALADDVLFVTIDLGETGYTELVGVLGNNSISGSDTWPNRWSNYYDPPTHTIHISMEIDDISNVRWDLQVIVYGLK